MTDQHDPEPEPTPPKSPPPILEVGKPGSGVLQVGDRPLG